jgi:hypothetical protein
METMFDLFKFVSGGVSRNKGEARTATGKKAAMALVAVTCTMVSGHAFATKFDCMGSALAGATPQGVGRQFGTRAGDWENAIKYVYYDRVTNKTAGMGFYWYCRLPNNSIRVNNLHATIAQLAALPDNTLAQIKAQGPAWLSLVQPRQCWEMEAANSYPSTDEKTLCQGLLAKARSVAPL